MGHFKIDPKMVVEVIRKMFQKKKTNKQKTTSNKSTFPNLERI